MSSPGSSPNFPVRKNTSDYKYFLLILPFTVLLSLSYIWAHICDNVKDALYIYILSWHTLSLIQNLLNVIWVLLLQTCNYFISWWEQLDWQDKAEKFFQKLVIFYHVALKARKKANELCKVLQFFNIKYSIVVWHFIKVSEIHLIKKK